MKERGDRGKGIEILETRILVKAVVPSIVGIYRNGFDTMYIVLSSGLDSIG